jgi:hypothetical protein
MVGETIEMIKKPINIPSTCSGCNLKICPIPNTHMLMNGLRFPCVFRDEPEEENDKD